jgi:hypothetical protein
LYGLSAQFVEEENVETEAKAQEMAEKGDEPSVRLSRGVPANTKLQIH